MNKNRITILLALALFFAPFFKAEEAHAATHQMTESVVGHLDRYHNGKFQNQREAKMQKVDGEMAYCISMSKTAQQGAAQEVNIKKYLPGDQLVVACLAQEHIFNMPGYSTNQKYMLTQCMIWYIQRESIGDGGWRQYVCGIDMNADAQERFFTNLEKEAKAKASRYEGHGTAWINVDFEDAQEVAILMAPTLKTGDLSVRKVSAFPEFVKENSCYSLKGAQYGVYSDSACKNLVTTMVTDEEGNTEKTKLEMGSYYIKEIKASKGYELDKTVYPVTITYGESKELTSKEVPGSVPLKLKIQKIDKETKEARPGGGASLEGAEFTVCYYDGFFTRENLPDYDTYPSASKRKWILKTVRAEEDGETIYLADISKRDCQVEGGQFYKLKDQNVLPLGTISIEETKAPEGYELDGAFFENITTGEKTEGNFYTAQITEDIDGWNLQGGSEFQMADQVIRGDLALRKIDGDNQRAMAGVEFKLTSKTTGESHTFTTDENGEYDTSSGFAKHSYHTNEGKAGDGIWFGRNRQEELTEVNDQEGALPYDTYEIEELEGENNKGMVMFKDTVVIKRKKTTVRLNNLENHKKEVQPEEPQIHEEEPKAPNEGPVIKKIKAEIVPQTKAAKTGDNHNLMHLMILMILSCATIITCGRIARKG